MAIPNIFSDQFIELPEGGEFTPSGFIAPWKAAVMSSFLVEGEGPAEADWTRPLGDSGWTACYFFDPKKAEAIYRGPYRPSRVWLWRTETSKVLNFYNPETALRFGTHISAEARVTALRSRYRHELHMISLPAAVAAVATAAGYDHPGFDLSCLMDPDTIFSDELYTELCGGEEGDLEGAKLWRQRAELWAALGEPDPRRYQCKEVERQFSTQAPKLNECLKILNSLWTDTLWGRVIFVPDPRPDASYESRSGEMKRPNLPCLVEVFGDETAARKAAGKSVKESQPPVPEAWQYMEADWKECVRSLYEATGGSKSIPAVAQAIKRLYGAHLGASPAEVIAWFEHLEESTPF